MSRVPYTVYTLSRSPLAQLPDVLPYENQAINYVRNAERALKKDGIPVASFLTEHEPSLWVFEVDGILRPSGAAEPLAKHEKWQLVSSRLKDEFELRGMLKFV